MRNYYLVLLLLVTCAASGVPDWVRAPVIVGGSPGSGMLVATAILAKLGVYMVDVQYLVVSATFLR
jgi:hypothetical protein